MPITDNPFVGPRTFEEKDKDRFFGREWEARELLSHVIAEPLVVFYAQSGAGKSSLINTRLVPGLREENFEVLPIGRVSGELPAGVIKVDNIFVFNLLLSLDQNQTDPHELTRLSLSKYLDSIKPEIEEVEFIDEEFVDEFDEEFEDAGAYDFEEPSRVLIIDQFEEIFTKHLDRWQDRKGFFRQLRQALAKDSFLWVVLSMREDYIAAMAPHAKLLPGKLRARFHMQRLGYEAAREVVEQTALRGGRPFAGGVARALVDNLRQLQSTDEETQSNLGEFVEPVQLQVVCYQLWENLKDRPAGEITLKDLQELGDVDKALAQFYEQALVKAIQASGVSEIDLRNWFEQKLITEAGTRGTVYQGPRTTEGLDNRAVEILAGQFLLRPEIRAGGTWYELVHDRFITPIQQSNQAWRLKQPLLQMAQTWADSDRQSGHLLEGQPLQDALASRWQALGPLVREFLEASQAAQQAKLEQAREEQEAQRRRELAAARRLAEEAEARRLAEQQRAEEARARAQEQAAAAQKSRRQATWLGIVSVIALLLALTAAWFGLNARDNAVVAQANAGLAATQEAEARTNAANAATSAAEAQANAELAATREVEAQAAAIEAQTNAQAAISQQETAIAAQATAEAERNSAVEARATLAANLEILLAAAEATPTPSPTGTANPDEVEDVTPTATPTATPDRAATETYATLQAQLVQVRATQTAVATVANVVPEGMVRVPAGSFWMGSLRDSSNLPGLDRNPEPDPDEFPQHAVALPEFFIDRTEVTNAAYLECVETNVCVPQAGGDPNYHTSPTFANHPVIFVSWEGAQTYCRWAGKRLPTEAEWEKAARGTDGRIWPWGNALKDNLAGPVTRANVADGVTGGPVAVGSYTAGASPYGALDMSGNVWEWVADWEDPNYYSKRPDPDENPPGPPQDQSTGRKIVRGGSYRSLGVDSRTAERNGVELGPSFDIGFRCAKSGGS